MAKEEHSNLDWIGERLIVAILFSLFAALTLFLYPIILSFFAAKYSGNMKGAGIFVTYYQILFSKSGLLLLISAGGAGFFMGANRVVSALSFFWGTHEFWPRLEEKLNDWRDEHCSPGRMFIVLMLILGIVLWIQFA